MKKIAKISSTIVPIVLTISFLSTACHSGERSTETTDELFALFQNPPAESRPFVRWWWNGDCIEVDELRRELDVMKAGGIGGVEINPIAHPTGKLPEGTSCYDWLSPEWNQRVAATLEMSHEREMVVDLMMGSGWPFGGEFLAEDQMLQGVGINKIELKGPMKITLSISEIWKLPGRNFGTYTNADAPDPELFFLQIIPHGAKGIGELRDLMDRVDEEGRFEIDVPEGTHDLYIGTFQKAYRVVMHGAPGSRGPVVDHYDREDVIAYMDRLGSALESVISGALGDHIRALFCDSIELSGSNITDDFLKEFFKRRGYRLEPYMALVYYPPYEGYRDTLRYSHEFAGDIRRIRYDFNKTLVELFLEGFTTTFDEWANAHGMQSRYQAYGMPWLMGMLDGYRLVDIPESNNWLYSANAKAHGFWIWNKYCSSGAHLSGSKIVSCEAMTNTRGVFRMPLNMVKKNDDFNFITGINHSVLHGYNYSPPEAGFPGWIRYGAYFSDQNTWWPYFRYWADYNARLSAIFQHAEPVIDVAILTPEADIWREWGLIRNPYYMNPWYHHDLWEGFSRNGITADYINEGVIRRGSADGNKLKSEHAAYQLVIVSASTAMEPETADAIRMLAEEGVRFVFIDRFPSESAGFYEKDAKDRKVVSQMEAVSKLGSVSVIDAPADEATITAWTGWLGRECGIKSDVAIRPVDEKLYTTKYRWDQNSIFFFSNQNETKPLEFEITLEPEDRVPWKWDPEKGTRALYPVDERGILTVSLQALESLLIVMDEPGNEMVTPSLLADDRSGMVLNTGWEMDFLPVSGEPFHLSAEGVFDFGTHPDPRVATFAGQVHYKTAFNLDDTSWDFLDLGKQEHITEVTLNGIKLGTRWWGRHLYRIDKKQLLKGENHLDVIYTSTLANYANALTHNEVAKLWIKLEQPEAMGLLNGITLLKAR